MKVRRRHFIMPDGTVKDEKDLTPEEYKAFCQKVVDVMTPLLYEAVMRDLQKERERKAAAN